MPLMPAEFYVPAFATLGGTIAVLSKAVQALYAARIELEKAMRENEAGLTRDAVRAIARNTEVINANARILEEVSRLTRQQAESTGSERRA